MKPSEIRDEQLITAVAANLSMASTLKALGLRLAGGNYDTVNRHIQRLGLSTDHWSNRPAHNKGVASRRKLSPDEVLVNNRLGGCRDKVRVLRRVLAEVGVVNECGSCGLVPYWNNKAPDSSD